MRKFAVLGNLNWDMVLRSIPDWPGWGRELFVDHISRIPGGIAHASLAASRLGAEVAAVGAVGNDLDGTTLITHLEQAGVHVEALRSPEAATGLSTAIVAPNAERTYFTYAGALATASPLDLWHHFREHAGAYRLLLVSGAPLIKQSSIKDWVELVTEAHNRKIEIALDLGWDPHEQWGFWRNILPLVDIVIVNAAEENVYLKPRFTPRLAIVKQGAGGARIIKDSATMSIPPFPTTPIDTGGAGDVWNGAFACRYLETGDLAQSAAFANAAASLYVSKPATESRYPYKESVLKLLREA